MSNRKRLAADLVIIADADQADAALEEIAGLDRAIRAINDEMQAAIDRIKSETAAAVKPPSDRRAALELGLAAYAAINRETLFGKVKTLDLVFGRLGFRKSTEIKPLPKWTWAQVLGRLKDLALPDAIRVKEEVDKETLHTYPEEKLSLVGARRVEKDEFWYEIKAEDIPKEAA